jgi:hypothetical protein
LVLKISAIAYFIRLFISLIFHIIVEAFNLEKLPLYINERLKKNLELPFDPTRFNSESSRGDPSEGGPSKGDSSKSNNKANIT